MKLSRFTEKQIGGVLKEHKQGIFAPGRACPAPFSHWYSSRGAFWQGEWKARLMRSREITMRIAIEPSLD